MVQYRNSAGNIMHIFI